MYKKYLLQSEREVQQGGVKNLKSEEKKPHEAKKKKVFLKFSTHSDKNRRIKVKCLHLDKKYLQKREKEKLPLCMCVGV